MNHTPGPWKVASCCERTSDGELIDVLEILRKDLVDEGYRETSQIARIDSKWQCADALVDEDHANARLIAAAPDLLAVAKRAIGQCACHSTMRPDIPCLSCQAREAIAKVTGKDGEG